MRRLYLLGSVALAITDPSVKRAISARRHLIPNRTLPNCIVFEMFCTRFAAMRIVECDGAVRPGATE